MRLIDADAMKKEWRMGNKCEECERNARDCNYYDFISRMDVCSMLDDAPTVSGWVSVKDRLPNCNGIYLVWRPHYYGGEIGEPVVCYFDGQNTWHDSYGVDFERILHPDDITHWMPLPEPPEVSENG